MTSLSRSSCVPPAARVGRSRTCRSCSSSRRSRSRRQRADLAVPRRDVEVLLRVEAQVAHRMSADGDDRLLERLGVPRLAPRSECEARSALRLRRGGARRRGGAHVAARRTTRRRRRAREQRDGDEPARAAARRRHVDDPLRWSTIADCAAAERVGFVVPARLRRHRTALGGDSVSITRSIGIAGVWPVSGSGKTRCPTSSSASGPRKPAAVEARDDHGDVVRPAVLVRAIDQSLARAS